MRLTTFNIKTLIFIHVILIILLIYLIIVNNAYSTVYNDNINSTIISFSQDGINITQYENTVEIKYKKQNTNYNIFVNFF